MRTTRRALGVLLAASLLALAPGAAFGELKILLTNDDGFDAPGITALHAARVTAPEERIARRVASAGVDARDRDAAVSGVVQAQRAGACRVFGD